MSVVHRRDDFTSFRNLMPYFMTRDQITDQNGVKIPGPSGASSAAFQSLDLLFGIIGTEEQDTKRSIRPRMKMKGYTTISDIDDIKNLVERH
jgi:hypothetical protein